MNINSPRALSNKPSLLVFLVIVSSFVYAVGPAFAGDNNSSFAIQDSGTAAVGNTLLIDQSLSNGSLFAGDVLGTLPASQIGGGNFADVKLTGSLSVGTLMQKNTASSAAVSEFNTAQIEVGMSSIGNLTQDGAGNYANLFVTDGATGELIQTGVNIVGNLDVRGKGSYGALMQVGTNLDQSLTVVGNGTSVTYTQYGTDVSTSLGVNSYTTGMAIEITKIN
jgi:hypothetical protein